MIDEDQRSRYWFFTLALAFGVVAVTAFCAFVLPLFAVELNIDSLLGFPLGFYLSAQGVMIILIIGVFWAGSRQTETDQKFGATDDI